MDVAGNYRPRLPEPSLRPMEPFAEVTSPSPTGSLSLSRGCRKHQTHRRDGPGHRQMLIKECLAMNLPCDAPNNTHLGHHRTDISRVRSVLDQDSATTFHLCRGPLVLVPDPIFPLHKRSDTMAFLSSSLFRLFRKPKRKPKRKLQEKAFPFFLAFAASLASPAFSGYSGISFPPLSALSDPTSSACSITSFIIRFMPNVLLSVTLPKNCPYRTMHI